MIFKQSSLPVRFIASLRGAMDVQRHFWIPAADVYEIASGWIIKLELAGVRPEEVAVTVEGNLLRIFGRRRDWIVEHTERCSLLEISYERFERRFELSGELERCRIVTQYEDGMLLVKILTEDAAP